jgi:flagellin-specific chaperone FliS
MKNEYQEIIETLDRIIAMQDRMIEKTNEMIGKMDNIIDEISSTNINNDAVTSMKTYDGPR